jgi:hypothetical protein
VDEHCLQTITLVNCIVALVPKSRVKTNGLDRGPTITITLMNQVGTLDAIHKAKIISDALALLLNTSSSTSTST